MDNLTCLDKIIDIVGQINYDAIPPETVQKAKECIADFIAVAFKGSLNPMSKKLRQAEEAPFASNTEDTALWLGSTARMPDIDDGHRFAMAHPGVAINSAALVTAWKRGKISGKQLIEAVVRAYEVYCYEGRVINPSAYLKRGIDATSVCGAAASATAVGSLMEFDRTQLCDAVSLAASISGGLNQSAIDGSAQKYIVAGWGAKTGIAAANMAAHGLGGPCRVFEGRLGFVNAFAPDPDTQRLHSPALLWDINNVYMKRYACVRRIHATLDAVSDIIKQEHLAPGDIAAVRVYGSQFLCDAVNYQPKDDAQGQTSVPYAVAILIAEGGVEDELICSHLEDQELLDYAKRITVEKDPEIVAMAEKDKSLWGAAKVEIETTDGTVFRTTQITPYGDPELPFPAGAVEEKFLRYVGEACGPDYARSLWATLDRLETVDNVQGFLQEMFTRFAP